MITTRLTSWSDSAICKHSHQGGPAGRSFLIIEGPGECEGSYGYWVEDEESGYEGFLPEDEDTFWLWDDSHNCRLARRFRGRRMTRQRTRKQRRAFGKRKGKKLLMKS